MAVLSGLKPERVFYYFEQWCQIPHGSGNTAHVRRFLTDFAQKHGLEYQVDAADNVLIRKPASPGYEDSVPVILQGHTDMVAEKEPGSSFNFETDGLKLYVEDGYVRAEGTTLGGDDGIAVAYALAILEDSAILHPPLEVLLTSNEESGLMGAEQFDVSSLQGHYLINLDSEEEGCLLAGCAGGLNVNCVLPVRYDQGQGERYEIRITGLKGGHSGTEIGSGRANANCLLGQVLFSLRQKCLFYLAELSGGKKHNVIPGEARAMVLAQKDDQQQLQQQLRDIQAQLRREYAGSDEGITITLTELGPGIEPVLHPISLEKVLFFLIHQTNGVIKMSGMIPGMVETSANLGVISLGSENFTALVSIRSSLENAKLQAAEKTCYLIEFLGGEGVYDGSYPAWEYREHSPLRELMCAAYLELFGTQPRVMTIHAGLECGLFQGGEEGLDCISMGPDILDIHSVKERLDIASVARVWDYLLLVLKKLK